MSFNTTVVTCIGPADKFSEWPSFFQPGVFAYLGRLEEARVAADRLLAIRTGLHHLEIREHGSIFPRTPDQTYRRRPAEGGAAGVNVDRKLDANFGVDLACRSLI